MYEWMCERLVVQSAPRLEKCSPFAKSHHLPTQSVTTISRGFTDWHLCLLWWLSSCLRGFECQCKMWPGPRPMDLAVRRFKVVWCCARWQLFLLLDEKQSTSQSLDVCVCVGGKIQNGNIVFQQSGQATLGVEKCQDTVQAVSSPCIETTSPKWTLINNIVIKI